MLTNLQAASYGSSPNSTPFLAYFEATTPASPAKHARLRTALFLQTSSAYDASAAGARLAPHAPLLAPELAIIAGKVCERSHSQLVPPPPPSLPSIVILKKKLKKDHSSATRTRHSRSSCELCTTIRPLLRSARPTVRSYHHVLPHTSRSAPGSRRWCRHRHRRPQTSRLTAQRRSGSCTSY